MLATPFLVLFASAAAISLVSRCQSVRMNGRERTQSGEVKVVKNDVELCRLQKFDHFGEQALLTDKKERQASVITVNEVKLLVMARGVW